MLISDRSIEVDKTFHLRLVLPEEIHAKKNMDFEASSLWCKRDINADFFDTGFKIFHLKAGEYEIIEYLTEEFGMKD